MAEDTSRLRQSIALVRGRSKRLRFPVRTPQLDNNGDPVLDGAGQPVLEPFDLTGHAVKFGLRDLDTGTRTELPDAAVVVVDPPTGGVVRVTVGSDVSDGLTGDRYAWELWLDDSGAADDDPLAGGSLKLIDLAR